VKLNLLMNPAESLAKGPGRRAYNLTLGLDRLGIAYEVCSENYEYAVGMQAGQVFKRWEEIPDNTPIGPNVMHNAGDHTGVAAKFKNFIVQSDWVADYWRWQFPEETKDFTFHIFPAAVDVEDGYRNIAKNRQPADTGLIYTKYQNKDNYNAASIIAESRGNAIETIKYGEYTIDQLKAACSKAKFCIYNSCCEKSSNALMEILACGVPVYVVDSKRWIGDDKFDRCTSAPHFDDRCGIVGDAMGKEFDDFIARIEANAYDPHSFVEEGYTVEKTAQILVDIVEACHGN